MSGGFGFRYGQQVPWRRSAAHTKATRLQRTGPGRAPSTGGCSWVAGWLVGWLIVIGARSPTQLELRSGVPRRIGSTAISRRCRWDSHRINLVSVRSPSNRASKLRALPGLKVIGPPTSRPPKSDTRTLLASAVFEVSSRHQSADRERGCPENLGGCTSYASRVARSVGYVRLN